MAVDIDNDTGLYYVMEITTERPKDPPSRYDLFTHPFWGWKISGLLKQGHLMLN